jgi:branched-chain amino acid transport system permease protein
VTDFLNAFVLLANFVLIPATAYGAQLALGALGVTLIYSVLRFANFAHGDMMAFGTAIDHPLHVGAAVLGRRHRTRCPPRCSRCRSASSAPCALALGTDRLVYRFYRRQRSAR